jgi:2-keto-4-pentenoate hydratase/2-oxohepta-3-ene-1,7-dioic acid hydratase in catechol pathway
LQDLYDALNAGRARHAFPFEPERCMAPLPRAYQWLDGSAYLNHVALVRAAGRADVPERFYTEPLMYQGGSDDFLGPCDDIGWRTRPSVSTSRASWPWSPATCRWAPRPSRGWTPCAC